MSFMHFAQTEMGKAEAGQRKVSGAVGTGRVGGPSNFLRGRASGTGDAMLGHTWPEQILKSKSNK